MKQLHEWENDSELMTFSRSKPMNFASMAQLEKQFEEWIKDDKTLRFMVDLMPQRDPIGTARVELSEWGNIRAGDVGTYIGNKEMWGRGLGRTITLALLEICFNQLNLERCEAWSVSYNERAHKVLESCGFVKGGVMRQTAMVNGKKWDSFHFDILKEEYLAKREALLKEVLGSKYLDYMEQLVVLH